MKTSSFSSFALSAAVTVSALSCTSTPATTEDEPPTESGATAEDSDPTDPRDLLAAEKRRTSDEPVEAVVRQPEGETVYWVLPGPRRLGGHFGTMADPEFTASISEDAPKAIRALIDAVPELVGVPLKMRKERDDGTVWTTGPTAFGDRGVPTSGAVEIRYVDGQPEDAEGPSEDRVAAAITFEDPDGHEYTLIPREVVQPPIPGYETGGGVLLDEYIHGKTGTGSPLMPKVYTYAAFWAVGDVRIDDEIVDESKVIHCMTTETVRNKEYELAHDVDLPLALDETIAGQKHHTHCMVMPIKMTADGPAYSPVRTAYELPNGEAQPFIHVMYENDEIVSGPEWAGPDVDPERRR